MFNPATGMWEDDQHPDGGSLGEQAAAPQAPLGPPPAAQAPGPEAPSPEPQAPPVVKIDEPFTIGAGPEPGAPSPGAPATPSVLPAPLPSVAPYSPTAPPPIPAGRVVSPAEAANLSATDKNTAAGLTGAQDKGALGMAAAQAKSGAADAEATAQQQFVQERQRISDEATKAIAAREQQANQDWQQYKNAGIHDPDADKSFGRKLLEAIAVSLGAYGSTLAHSSNTAAQMISDANKENIDRQKAQQEKLFQQAQHSGKDVEGARQERDDAFKQLDLKHSALLESSAAALRAQLAKIGIPQAQVDANTDVQKLETDALSKREDVLKSIREDETSLAKANIAAAERRARHAAAAGAGRTDALAQFAERAGQLQPGEAIPADLAVLGRQAGLKPAQIATEVERYAKKGEGTGRGAGAGAAGGADIARDEQGNPLGRVASGRGGAAAFTTRDADYARAASQLQALREDIQKNGDRVFTPEAIKRRNTLYENAKIAVATVSPLGKTDEAMKAEAGSLGSSGAPTSIMGIAGGANPSAIASKLEELKRQRQAYRNETLTPLTPEEAGRAQKGRGVGIPGEAPRPAAGPDPRVKLAREAIADPAAPPAAKARALQILRSRGADSGDIRL